MNQRVLVVEFGDSHHEIFPTHFRILDRAGYETYAFVNARIADRIPHGFQQETIVFEDRESPLRTAGRILSFCRKRGIRKVVLNSANGNAVRTFALAALAWPGLEVVGINHYVRKFRRSVSQKFISRKVRRYFVLSDIFFENGSLRPDEGGLTIRSLYPVFFPEAGEEAAEEPGQVLLAVPGTVRQERRDYLGLLDLLAAKRSLVPDHVRFLILGDASSPDGRRFRSEIQRVGLDGFFRTFEGHVDNEIYYRLLRRADLMLPLLHVEGGRYREFLDHKVSGSYALGMGFRIPFLMHRAFEGYSDFRDVSFFYDREDFVETLARAVADPRAVAAKREAYGRNPKLSLEAQTKTYLEILDPRRSRCPVSGR